MGIRIIRANPAPAAHLPGSRGSGTFLPLLLHLSPSPYPASCLLRRHALCLPSSFVCGLVFIAFSFAFSPLVPPLLPNYSLLAPSSLPNASFSHHASISKNAPIVLTRWFSQAPPPVVELDPFALPSLLPLQLNPRLFLSVPAPLLRPPVLPSRRGLEPVGPYRFPSNRFTFAFPSIGQSPSSRTFQGGVHLGSRQGLSSLLE